MSISPANRKPEARGRDDAAADFLQPFSAQQRALRRLADRLDKARKFSLARWLRGLAAHLHLPLPADFPVSLGDLR